MSAAERSVSPASTPSPPLYVGIACSRQISMEKYATVDRAEVNVMKVLILFVAAARRARRGAGSASARRHVLVCPMIVLWGILSVRRLETMDGAAWLAGPVEAAPGAGRAGRWNRTESGQDRKSTRLNS